MSSHYFTDLQIRTLENNVENLSRSLVLQDEELQELVKANLINERSLHKLLVLSNKRMRELEKEVAELKEDKELLMENKKNKKNE